MIPHFVYAGQRIHLDRYKGVMAKFESSIYIHRCQNSSLKVMLQSGRSPQCGSCSMGNCNCLSKEQMQSLPQAHQM